VLPEAGAVRSRPNLDRLIEDWPWTQRDTQTIVSRLAVSLVVIVAGWVGASSTAAWNEQLIWVGVGLAGLLIGGLALLGWVLNGFATVSVERTIIRGAIAQRRERQVAQRAAAGARGPQPEPAAAAHAAHAAEPADPAEPASADTEVLRAGRLLAAEGMTHFHRPGCQALQGKSAQEHTLAEYLRSGMSPCGMCAP
jgi:hypothetical protein